MLSAFLKDFALIVVLALQGVSELTLEEQVRDAVSEHAKTIKRIDDIYVKIVISTRGPTDSVARKVSTTETWRSGRRERQIVRIFLNLGTDGFRPSQAPTGDVAIESYANQERRHLIGWDPKHPLQLPVTFAEGIEAFSKVKGQISGRDPVGGTSTDWTRLLMEFGNGRSLANVVNTAEIVPLAPESPKQIRFLLKTADSDVLAGTTIELDAKHGYMVRAVTWKDGSTAIVEEFAEFGEGIWLPKLQKRVTGPYVTTIELIEGRVNEPIPESELIVNFPEGCRVDDLTSDTPKIHIWGKDGPHLTFNSHDDFIQYGYQQIREHQRATGALGGATLLTNGWIWANICLVVLLFVLIVVRRRYLGVPSV